MKYSLSFAYFLFAVCLLLFVFGRKVCEILRSKICGAGVLMFKQYLAFLTFRTSRNCFLGSPKLAYVLDFSSFVHFALLSFFADSRKALALVRSVCEDFVAAACAYVYAYKLVAAQNDSLELADRDSSLATKNDACFFSIAGDCHAIFRGKARNEGLEISYRDSLPAARNDEFLEPLPTRGGAVLRTTCGDSVVFSYQYEYCCNWELQNFEPANFALCNFLPLAAWAAGSGLGESGFSLAGKAAKCANLSRRDSELSLRVGASFGSDANLELEAVARGKKGIFGFCRSLFFDFWRFNVMRISFYLAFFLMLCSGANFAKDQNPASSPEVKNPAATAESVTAKTANQDLDTKSVGKNAAGKTAAKELAQSLDGKNPVVTASQEPAPKSANQTETVKNTQEASPVLTENLDINWART